MDESSISGENTDGDGGDKINLLSEITDVDLLVIGRTGSGKSALVSSILRRKAFTETSRFTYIDKKKCYDFGEFNGRIIKVVEGTGFRDIRSNQSFKFALKAMHDVITVNPSGYHACLLVTKYGERFTAEDQDTIILLKTIFGEHFVKNYGILVMTCGDYFDTEDFELNFQQWCAKNTGVFAELLNECQKRVVLFDNRTIDERKIMTQLSELMKMVESLNGNRFQNEDFISEYGTRIKLLLEGNIKLKEKYLNDIGLICRVLKNTACNDNTKNHIDKLNKLLKNTKLLFDNITQLEKRPGDVRDCAEVIIEIFEGIILAQDAQQEEKNEKLENQRLAFVNEEKDHLEKVAILNNQYHQEKEAHENDLQHLRQTQGLQIQQMEAYNKEKESRYIDFQNEQHFIIARQKEDIDKLQNMMVRLNNGYQQEKEAHENERQNLRQAHDVQIQQLKAENTEKESRYKALHNEQLATIARQKEDIDKLHNMMENILSVLKSDQTSANESLASLKSIEGIMEEINDLPIKTMQTKQMNQLLDEIAAKFDKIGVNS